MSVQKVVIKIKNQPWIILFAFVFFVACKSKMNVSVDRGSQSAAQQTSASIASKITASLSQRGLEKTKLDAIATAAGEAGSLANTSGQSIEAQATAALSAAMKSVYEQFSSSQTDIKSASQAVSEAIANWLLDATTTENYEVTIKSATTSILTAISANATAGSANATSSLNGIFGSPTYIELGDKTLADFSTAAMTSIAIAADSSDTNLSTIAKSASSQLTSSIVSQATITDIFSTAVAALFKGVSDAASSTNISSTTLKSLLDQITKDAATALAQSSLSESAKSTDISILKSTAASTIDTLVSQGTISTADAAVYKASTEAQTTTSTTSTSTSPEINVKQNTTSLASGNGSHSFGSVAAGGGTVDVIFTIENTGTGSLSLSGIPKVALSGTNASDFSVTSQPSATVAASSTGTFTVRFAPSTAGAKTATVTITNNDSDEGSYTFSITGTGTVVAAPEINIKQGSTNLASGSGSQSLGSAVANSGTADLTFTIENSGTAVLNISGTPRVALSGANAAEFSVTSQPAATVASSGTSSFTIRFAPTSAAAKTATVTVANDDSDEGTYTFTITGTGTTAVVGSNSQIGNPSTFNQTNSAPANIENWSNTSNAVSGDGAAATTSALSDAKVETARLELTGFNFSNSIPSTATIRGIEVEIYRRASNMTNSATCRDLTVQLIVGGTPTGGNLASANDWPSAYASATYGGSSNLWSLSPTAADIRGATFGIAITTQIALAMSTGTCTAEIEYVKMTVHYTPAAYRIFTTTLTYTGNLGGLTGADAKCQAQADSASLTGTWKAILSDSGTNASGRLSFASGIDFTNMLGTTVATSAADLWDGTISDAVNFDQLTAPRGHTVWTGSAFSGLGAAEHCLDWSSTNNAQTGRYGNPSDSSTPNNWLSSGTITCDLSQALLCVAQ